MDRLPTRVNRADSEYQMRKEHNLALISTLRERLDTASNGGGGKYVDRHRGRGKLLPRVKNRAYNRPRNSIFGTITTCGIWLV